MRGQRGLTLIELLIAMSLMALLAILGYRAFASLLIARERLMSTGSQWNDLAHAFAQVERDVAQLPPGQVNALALQQGWLTLNVPNAGVPDGREWRRYRPASGGLAWSWGTASSVPANDWPLLEASGTRWQVGLQNGAWRDSWPDGNDKPILLKLTVKLADGGEVERVWALP